MGDVLGYARVSTGDQDLAGQKLRLEAAGALRIFEDVRSGRNTDRAGLRELLAYARPGAGGVTRSLSLDTHGKCLGSVPLELEIPELEIPDRQRST